MPTDILRQRSDRVSARDRKPRPPPGRRHVILRIGRVKLLAALLDTPTADRIWGALPLHSSAETWGQAIRFELPIESGRERGARTLGTVGELYFWTGKDRVILPYGPTAISRPGEIRLPSPCNPWAKLMGDPTPLKAVTPGEKVSITRG
jgi:hypothetical protein